MVMVFPLRKDGASQVNWDFINNDGIAVEEEVGEDLLQKDDVRSQTSDDDDNMQHIPINVPSSTEEGVENEDAPAEDEEERLPPEPETPPRRSARERTPVERYLPSNQSNNVVACHNHESFEAMKARAEPKSYKMAMKLPDAKKWREACDKEIKNIMDMGVWEIVDRPSNSPLVGGRWHFKLKLNPDGSIAKYKARSVAKGFTQTEGVDFNDTYAPTGRLASFRVLVSVAAARGWCIEQMDAIDAFLNSDLQEEIYLELPEGYDEEKAKGKVARLRKALYGLKQSAKCWNDDVKEKFKQMGLKQNPHDACLWYRRAEDGRETIIYIHVDDMAITGNEIAGIKAECSWD